MRARAIAMIARALILYHIRKPNPLGRVIRPKRICGYRLFRLSLIGVLVLRGGEGCRTRLLGRLLIGVTAIGGIRRSRVRGGSRLIAGLS